MRTHETLHKIHTHVLAHAHEEGYELTLHPSSDPSKPHAWKGRHHRDGFDVHLELHHDIPDDIAPCTIHAVRMAKGLPLTGVEYAVWHVCQELARQRYNFTYFDPETGEPRR